MKLSQVFRGAKKHLAMNPAEERAGKTEFICYAIDRVWTGLAAWQANAARRVISERLEGYRTATDWLLEMAGVDAELLRPKISADSGYSVPHVQKWRQAWLDSLIAEFEAKGD